MCKLKAIALCLAVAGLSSCASTVTSADPTTATKPAPTDANALYRAAREQHLQLHYESAIAGYRAAIAADPKHVDAYNGLGAAYAAQKRYAEAIDAFKAALEIAPDSAYVQGNLGTAYLQRGDSSEAIQALERARQLDPGNRFVLKALLAAYEKALEDATARAARLAAAPSPAVTPQAGPHIVPVENNIYELRLQGTPAPIPPAVQPAMVEKSESGAKLSAARVEVSNGNGVQKMASRVSRLLAEKGFSVGRLTNHLPFRDTETVVQYRAGYRDAAARLAAALPVKPALSASETLRADVDVRLMLGKDWIPTTASLTPRLATTARLDARLSAPR